MQRSLLASTKTEVSHILQSSYKEKHTVLFESDTLNRNAIIGSYSAPGVTNINISAIIQKMDNKSCETEMIHNKAMNNKKAAMEKNS